MRLYTYDMFHYTTVYNNIILYEISCGWIEKLNSFSYIYGLDVDNNSIILITIFVVRK